eukprot:403350788
MNEYNSNQPLHQNVNRNHDEDDTIQTAVDDGVYQNTFREDNTQRSMMKSTLNNDMLMSSQREFLRSSVIERIEDSDSKMPNFEEGIEVILEEDSIDYNQQNKNKNNLSINAGKKKNKQIKRDLKENSSTNDQFTTNEVMTISNVQTESALQHHKNKTSKHTLQSSHNTNQQDEDQELQENGVEDAQNQNDISYVEEQWLQSRAATVTSMIFKAVCSTISFLNLILLILYVSKEKFATYQLYQSYVGLVVFRPFALLILGIFLALIRQMRKRQQLYKEQQERIQLPTDSQRSTTINQQDFTLSISIKEQVVDEDESKTSSNKVGLIKRSLFFITQYFITYFGFFRFLSMSQQTNQVVLAYLMELFLQIISILYLQVKNTSTNNVRNVSDLSDLSIAIMVINIVVIMIELVLLVFKYQRVKKYRKDHELTIKAAKKRQYQEQVKKTQTGLGEARKITIPGPFQKSTNEIVLMYFKRNILLSLGLISIFILIIISLEFSLSGMGCPPKEGFRGNTCEPCTDNNCIMCSQNYGQCQQCNLGYYKDANYECQQCNTSGCVMCDAKDTCSLCQTGYRLQNSKCILCDMTANCAECNSQKCIACLPGYYFDESEIQCLKCSDKLAYCDECNNGDQCQSCRPGIAINSNGKCECDSQHGWETINLTQSTFVCKCNDYVMSSTNRCYSCDSIISGCGKCTNTDEFKESVRYLGLTDYKPTQKKYLQCDSCIDSYFYNNDQSRCEQCAFAINNCNSCDGPSKCKKCLEGFYLDTKTGDKNQQCVQCLTQIDNCQRCAGKDSCIQCMDGFIINQNGQCV